LNFEKKKIDAHFGLLEKKLVLLDSFSSFGAENLIENKILMFLKKMNFIYIEIAYHFSMILNFLTEYLIAAINSDMINRYLENDCLTTSCVYNQMIIMESQLFISNYGSQMIAADSRLLLEIVCLNENILLGST
jgi:hypothetical protein